MVLPLKKSFLSHMHTHVHTQALVGSAVRPRVKLSLGRKIDRELLKGKPCNRDVVR